VVVVVLGLPAAVVGGTVARERGSRWMESPTSDTLAPLTEIGVWK
jgi:hypothetical protein